ncbi:small GTPase Cdc42 [Mycena sanguinolenta]|nr:small GTPase Cdc42 [Mycena sanguinolenta]
MSTASDCVASLLNEIEQRINNPPNPSSPPNAEPTALQLKNAKKLIVLGDWGVGKTSLIISFTTKEFPGDYCVTLFDHSALSVKLGEETHWLWIFDTGGGEDYDRLRPLSYPQTDVFVICFCVTKRASFKTVRTKWVPEIRHHLPDCPFLLVATQIDLRNDAETVKKLAERKERPVTFKQGEQLAHEMGAAKYLECSARTLKGVDDVFEQALLTALGNWPVIQRKPKRKCIVL